MKFRKKREGEGRNENPVYKKQQAYHYSAKRSSSDRLYGRKEQTDDSENTTRAASRNRLKYLPSFISIGLILVGVFYLLHVSPTVALETEGSTGFVGDHSAVQAKANELAGSSWLNKTKLTFNEQELEESLRESFPEFSKIDVSTSLFRQKPVVSIRFAEPTLLLTTGSSNYIISEEGIVLADITRKQPDIDTSKLTLVQDKTGVDIEVGKVALTSDQVRYIKEIVYQTTQKKLNIESLILAPGGGELNARYGGLKYFVKYNLYEDARKSVGTFLATKANLESKSVTPAAYIDVRIPERAYVK